MSTFYLRNNGVDDTIAFYVPGYSVLFVIVFSVTISAIAGSVPARRASKLDPVIALRDE